MVANRALCLPEFLQLLKPFSVPWTPQVPPATLEPVLQMKSYGLQVLDFYRRPDCALSRELKFRSTHR